MNCRLCGSETSILFKSLLLNKHEVGYHNCPTCDLTQTDQPFWLDEAYSSAITGSDIGLVSRNVHLSGQVELILNLGFPKSETMLDFAGGTGMFVRLMRDKGFHFKWSDSYAENDFSKSHEAGELENQEFDVLTAFEVWEHLAEPKTDLDEMFELADILICSTELKDPKVNAADQWWYFQPEHGQHVAFYSLETLKWIAKKHNRFLITNYSNLHVFSKNKPSQFSKWAVQNTNPLFLKILNRLFGRKRVSLLSSDYNNLEMVKVKI